MSGTSAPPLNKRIKDHVLSRILSGAWPEGHRIPTEKEFCETFGTSRMTVNRAIRELTEMGYLTRSPGSGTFVAKTSMNATMLEIRSIRREIEDRGGQHRSRVLSLSRAPLDSELAARLGVAAETPMALLQSVHSDGARPIQFERRYVNLTLVPAFLDQDFATVTASDYLLAAVPYTSAEHTIMAVGAEGPVAEHLELAPGTPCLELRRRTMMGEVLITDAELIHPGQDLRLSGKISALTSARLIAS